MFEIFSIHCLGLFERYDSIQRHSKRNQTNKNDSNDNYNYYGERLYQNTEIYNYENIFFFKKLTRTIQSNVCRSS